MGETILSNQIAETMRKDTETRVLSLCSVVRSFDHLFSYGRSPRPRNWARGSCVGARSSIVLYLTHLEKRDVGFGLYFRQNIWPRTDGTL